MSGRVNIFYARKCCMIKFVFIKYVLYGLRSYARGKNIPLNRKIVLHTRQTWIKIFVRLIRVQAVFTVSQRNCNFINAIQRFLEKFRRFPEIRERRIWAISLNLHFTAGRAANTALFCSRFVQSWMVAAVGKWYLDKGGLSVTGVTIEAVMHP